MVVAWFVAWLLQGGGMFCCVAVARFVAGTLKGVVARPRNSFLRFGFCPLFALHRGHGVLANSSVYGRASKAQLACDLCGFNVFLVERQYLRRV